MGLPYPNKNQWRILWAACALLSFLWIADHTSSLEATALEVFGAPALVVAVLLFWKFSQKPSDPKS